MVHASQINLKHLGSSFTMTVKDRGPTRFRLLSSALSHVALALAASSVAITAQAQTTGTSISLSSLIQSIPSGTGYAAWDLCSRAVAVGDDFNRVKMQYTAPKVQPPPWVWVLFTRRTKST